MLGACSPAGKAQTSGAASNKTQTTTKTQFQSGATQAQPTRSGRDPQSGLLLMARSALPAEGQRTLSLIGQGGPVPPQHWPYQKDGVVFSNRERILPKQSSGYYHEYTVPTPQSADRGARRIVCGPPRSLAAECYYTADHYASFKRIAP
ncbi:ribonuclease [Deinococcus detaillensis]|uniref:Ribonuclease n=2 Tax=Deinococcus detaillensis TaxID=2592048 RepID=A0A553V4L3_9DEIO|nr:ribonuclease [Deinococcus detaillensis]